ncbi:MAG: mobile mystery protein B [Bacteroidia bacterium]|nr:mobile mystery protein B [Bacteroidia bacterium]
MGLSFVYLPGQTPLDESEAEGLRIPGIQTHAELDEFEQQNIEEAMLWSLRRSFRPAEVFSEAFIRRVHQQMFGNVWNWAGEFRQSEKNLGINRWQIPGALKCLLDDALYWQQMQVYSPDEAALRFKHRLVSIHCFCNGNGRHSRLLADIITSKLRGQPVFSWGRGNLARQGLARSAYLHALRAADAGDIVPLLRFARS